jgi:hypothetical protein
LLFLDFFDRYFIAYEEQLEKEINNRKNQQMTYYQLHKLNKSIESISKRVNTELSKLNVDLVVAKKATETSHKKASDLKVELKEAKDELWTA